MSIGNSRIEGKHPFRMTPQSIVAKIAIAMIAASILNYLDIKI